MKLATYKETKTMITVNKFLLISVSLYLVSAIVASAALLPCGPGTGKDRCQFCDLATLIAKVINFIFYDFALPLSVVFIVWGGIMIMTAGGSTERAKKGRDIIKAAVIGLLMILGAWLIVQEVLEILTGGTVKLNPANFRKVFCQ